MQYDFDDRKEVGSEPFRFKPGETVLVSTEYYNDETMEKEDEDDEPCMVVARLTVESFSGTTYMYRVVNEDGESTEVEEDSVKPYIRMTEDDS